MTDIQAHFDDNLKELIDKATDGIDLKTEEATTVMKNLKLFSDCRPPAEPVPEPIPEAPTTRWGRFKCGIARVWDNETTRVLIKASGPIIATGTVIYATIQKDHVIERQALAQANQRSN